MKNKLLLIVMGFAIATQTLLAQAPSYVPSNGLLGYWSFNGNANDLSGNGNNGTNNGAILTADRFGNPNNAYSFNGINSFIQIPNNTNLQNFSAMTISAWVKVNQWYTYSNTNWFPIVSKSSTATPGYFSYGFNQNYFYSNINSNQSESPTYISPLNQWVNCTVVFEATSVKYYVNGVLIGTDFTFVSLGTIDSNGDLFIGKDDPGITEFANGIIDDLGIWNRALTQEEISDFYNANQCFTNITVTDTLVINVGQLSFNDPIAWANNITISPNPASTQININFNNITNLAGGSLNIINSMGQSVAITPITSSGTQTTMQLSVWGGTGMYFVQIINSQGQIVDIKKIILQ